MSATVMSSGIVAVAYIVAALLFVLSLAGLSKHETAKTGNTYGIVGMAVALVATIWVVFDNRGYAVGWQAALVFLPMIVGGAIGVWRALRVEMTGMPQLIAMLHSFVGLAAVLVGYNTWLLAESAATDTAEPRRGPPHRGVPRHLHRRRHPDRLDRGVPQAERPDPE